MHWWGLEGSRLKSAKSEGMGTSPGVSTGVLLVLLGLAGGSHEVVNGSF